MLDSKNSNERSNGEEIVDRLQVQYHSFAASSAEHEKSKTGLAGLFNGWFRSMAPTEPEPLCAEFLTAVEALVNQLADAMYGASAEARDETIQKAASIMLAAKPINNISQAEWYMIVAEHSFSVLIPLLTPAAIKSIRDNYLQSHPKQFMYPCQRALLTLLNKNI